MKNVIIRIMSLLVILCYSLSIIGFDVHTCKGSGRSFVVAFFEGMNCEDIHPEHDCSDHGTCCRHHESSCCGDHEEDDDCCTNEIEVLDTVVVTNADEDGHILFPEMLSCLFIECNYDVLLFPESIESSYIPDSGRVIQPDCQAVLNIWRI